MHLTDVTLKQDADPSLDNIESFRMMGTNGVEYTFRPGEKVWLEHTPTDSRAVGVIGSFFGVGRLRGVHIETEAFGQRSFYFGQPGDHESGYWIAHAITT